MSVIKIGTSCSPAKIVNESVCICHKLVMSCGGGMGGSRWDEYIVDLPFDDVKANEFIRCHNYKGDLIMINTNFLVKCTVCKVHTLVEDISGWFYYGKATGDSVYKTIYFAYNVDDKVEFVSQYKSYSDIKDITVIETISTAKKQH